MNSSIDKLTEYFKKFPGIGPRQAKRFVYFLLSQNESFIDAFIKDIQSLRKNTVQCGECYIYFTRDNYSELCDVCSRSDTDISTLLIVAKDVDIEAIKRANIYKGRYFVLGGTLPFLEKKPEQFIRSIELQKYIESKKNNLKEIIFALPVTPEGDNTRVFLQEVLNPYNATYKTLGRGLSTGTELEYSDSETIISAFNNRY